MMRSPFAPRRRRAPRIAAAVAAVLLVVAAIVAYTAGFFDRDPLTLLPASGKPAGITAIYFSGDMGLRFGMGPITTKALAARGVPVLGVASSTLFRTRHSAAETDAIVASAIRQGVARAGADKLIVIGQSYGADILQTGLGALPDDLRKKIAAVILVVPGARVYFRADPTNIAYQGTPDADGAAALRKLNWVPVTCIYGLAEGDSACPAATKMTNATIVGMPGGHFLNHDSNGLIGQVLVAIGGAGGIDFQH